MTSISKKIRRIYQTNGFNGLIEAACFKFLSKIFTTPTRKIALFNGVAVRGVPFFAKQDIFPSHENELISSIRKYVTSGQTVILIGGGSGASTVVAAHQVGTQGKVIAYEANKNSFLRCQDTIKINHVENIVNVYHSIIEKPVYLKGEIGNPQKLLAKELSYCDVLVMDCEGAETPILENLKIRPRLIIVETHPLLGSPKEKIESLLISLNYKIIETDSTRDFLDVLVATK